MNAETLEALLIDRALGQLSPEVEVLLAEHLATHPEAAHSAAELAETVALAARVLQRPTPRLILPPRAVVPFSPRRTQRLLALAASFVAGAGAAFFALRSAASQVPPAFAQAPAPAVIVAQAAPPRRGELDPAIRALPFWSKERALAVASAKPPAR